jgi:hypothetical protein
MIASEVASTNSLESLVAGKVGKGFTTFVEHMNPGFSYAQGPQRTAFDSEDGPYFHLSFYVKLNGSEHAGPLYLSLCWLSRDKNWGLAGLITDQCLGMSTIF